MKTELYKRISNAVQRPDVRTMIHQNKMQIKEEKEWNNNSKMGIKTKARTAQIVRNTE